MTCAECQDLLLDLAYGELSAERAAEVEAHLAQCPGCREARARIERTRRMVAPLRAVEEPSASFDEPILRAARAEATMQADGTPGDVVEVTASVKPLGLQPARVDPHGEVNVARPPPQRRWMRRIAIAGSIAAAASLAVVVGISLQPKPQPSPEEVPALTVRAPVVPSAVDEARRNAEAAAPAAGGSAVGRGTAPVSGQAREGTASAPVVGPAPVTPAPGARAFPVALPAPPAPPAAASKNVAASESKEQEQPPASAEKSKHAKRALTALPERSASRESLPAPQQSAAPEAPPPQSSAAREAAPPQQFATHQAAPPQQSAAPEAPPPQQSAARDEAARARRDLASGALQARPESQAPAVAAAKRAEAPSAAEKLSAAPRDADTLETSAEASRRAGRYEAAAQLYRDAAAARRSSGDGTRAAWNLAHAVECLAAASLLDEAARVREDLLREFPREDGPRRAADRALGYPQR